MPTLLREKTVTARKQHTCETCNATAVQPGDTYRRSTYAYDGRVYDWVQCDPCRNMAAEVFSWVGVTDEGVTGDDYTEWACEYVIHGSPEQQVMAKNYLERRDNR